MHIEHWIDLRSDTVTQPTPAMREAMKKAPVGDDVFEDDPTLKALEAAAAARLGKEAALFVPTGCMGNLVAIMAHTTPGDEIILGPGCHIMAHELASAARVAGVAYAAGSAADGSVTAADIAMLARPANDPLSPRTGLVCLENALGNGRVVAVNTMQEAYAAAKRQGIPVHLDGARIFNAALALGSDAKQLAACADSVMFCVSKGLCAPVGSLLCGEAAFIQRARKIRKLLGGGMRQAGVLAACGLLALELMPRRLREDHENAETLARLLADIPGIELAFGRRDINMVFWRPSHAGFDNDAFIAHMRAAGVKVLGADNGEYRFVTHKDVSTEDVQTAATALAAYMATL